MHKLRIIEGSKTRGQCAIPHYLALGATLYLPATRTDLAEILNLEKLPGLRSVVVCTEDAIFEHELPLALANLERVLEQLQTRPVLRFIRPRNVAVLTQLVRLPGIERIDGIVLPKVTVDNLPAFTEAASRIPSLQLMPTLETEIAFDRRHLETLRDALKQIVNPILCVRIGANDLLSLLGLKRPQKLTVYDTPLRNVINDIILTFRPAGYEIAAPVFEHVDSPTVLGREVALDIIHGLLTKTAIHPTQIPVIEKVYRVSRQERELAEQILDRNAQAVFKYHGQMCEPATHRRWAERLLLRSELFGIG
jgi:citrate lyase beta subunit